MIPPLPMTVISGYLGAGKTTLINQMLADPKGLRLTVMVNDFGAINIDAALITAQSDDVIALTNGCVCCTMGADLFMALGDVLDRRPRADHLIVEASGIADPKAIANAAIAEPELRYAGIVTLVDALNIGNLLSDPLIAPQVHRQIAVADMVLQTKRDTRDPALDVTFTDAGLDLPAIMPTQATQALMLGITPSLKDRPAAPHPAHTSWEHRTETVVEFDRLKEGLERKPAGLYRIKGIINTTQGTFEIHAVGDHSEIKPTAPSPETTIVGLGLSAALTRAQIDAWWHRIQSA